MIEGHAQRMASGVKILLALCDYETMMTSLGLIRRSPRTASRTSPLPSGTQATL
jgi:hypothetical protein